MRTVEDLFRPPRAGFDSTVELLLRYGSRVCMSAITGIVLVSSPPSKVSDAATIAQGQRRTGH